MRRSLLASVLLVVSVVPASAVDVPLAGDRARLSDLRAQRRAQVISYSSAIDVSTLDPTVSGATLDLYSVTTGEQLTLSLPANVWEGPLPGRRFRFTGTGDPKMKILLVNGRLVRITLKGPGGFALGGQPQVELTARLTVGDTRFCMSFGGVIAKDDGQRFVARLAPPPTPCPAAPNDAPPPFCVGKPDGTACDDGKACTASSRCVAGVCASESPTCTGRLYDQNFCNLATGACETIITNTCATHPPDDLCRTLDTDINAATGSCFYPPPALCHSFGCNPSVCNPETGGCEEMSSSQCDAPCSEPAFPDEPCFAGTCTEERCVPNSDDIPNCNAESILSCHANSNHCFVPIPDDNANQVFLGCREGVGCVYTAIDCTVSQPFGPPDPCTEYYNDPGLAGCCSIRSTDCAGKFGNAPGYTYSCDLATDTCRATPE